MANSLTPLSVRLSKSRPKRRKQFVRPYDPPSVAVTGRDLDILEHVWRHRFLTSEQIAALFPIPEADGDRATFEAWTQRRTAAVAARGLPSPTPATFEHWLARWVAATERRHVAKIAKRCGLLWAAGLLDKPRRQVDYHVPGGGSRSRVFATSLAGAAMLVEAKRAHDIDDLDWSKKNKNAGRLFIHHTLAIADFSIALVRAGRMRLDHKILDFEPLIATLPTDTQARDKPWAWGPASLPPGYGAGRTATITNVPDHAFRIDLPDGTRRAFLVEIDRATMPVARKNLHQTSILKKLLAYHFGHRLKLHQTLFGWNGLRFLIVTTTPARVANILKVIKANPDLFRDTKGEHFWLTDQTSLMAAPDILSHAWQCADGSTKAILGQTLASGAPVARHRTRQA